MELCNFTSLFEIFCTIYLAYIVTDNFTDSNFIATITEKILRKYTKIESSFKKIDAAILGSETTLNNVEIRSADDLEDGEIKNTILHQQKHRDEALQKLKTQINKISLSKKEVNSTIKNSYQTKAFSIISLYLALYCILVLLFAGVSQGQCGVNQKFDNCLLSLNVFTIFFLYFGWKYDVEELINGKKSIPYRCVSFIAKLGVNGYVFTLWSTIIVFFLCIGSYFVPQIEFKFVNIYHNLLVILTLFIPILNFIIYFKKASNRADNVTENLTEKVNSIENDALNDLKEIDKIIAYFEINHDISIQVISK